jgi:hypothetical protein
MIQSRPVPVIERFFIALEDSDAPHRAQCCCQHIVEGEGELDPQALRRAVARASLANPGSRLVLRGHLAGLHWQVSDQVTPMRVMAHSLWDGESLDHAGFMFPSFDFRRGPTTEVLLIRAPVCRLVVRAHHAVMDGRGVMTFMEDIFRCLRGEQPLGSTLTVNYADLARRPDVSLPLPRGSQAPLATGPSLPATSAGYTLQRREVNVPGRGVLPRVVDSLARQAFAANPAAQRLRFLMPADLRPSMPGLRSTANLASALSITVQRGDGVAQITQSIRAALVSDEAAQRVWQPVWSQWLLSCVPIACLRLILRYCRWQRQRGRLGFMYTASVSNLGRLPVESYACEGFKARRTFLPPPFMSTAGLMVVIGGDAGQQQLLAMSPEFASSAGRVSEMMDRLVLDMQQDQAEGIPAASPEPTQQATDSVTAGDRLSAGCC